MVPLPNIFLILLFSNQRLKRKDFQEIARLAWAQEVWSSNLHAPTNPLGKSRPRTPMRSLDPVNFVDFLMCVSQSIRIHLTYPKRPSLSGLNSMGRLETFDRYDGFGFSLA
jgi:hypothetical protein